MKTTLTVLTGDWIEQLRTLPAQSVHCCVTSPPYWGLRDYGVAGQLGLEKTPEEYVAKLVAGFGEVKRALRDDGTIWVNLGDTMWGGNKGNSGPLRPGDKQATNLGSMDTRRRDGGCLSPSRCSDHAILKVKDMIGIPWRVAFALQADGWYLRSDIIWSKPNPMPESVTDRPTKSHEYIFLLSKNERYFYDAEAIKEPSVSDHDSGNGFDGRQGGSEHLPMSGGVGTKEPWRAKRKLDKEGANSRIHVSRDPSHEREYNGKYRTELEQAAGRRLLKNVAEARANGGDHDSPFGTLRNKRTVWTVATSPYKEAHFATFPPDLIKPCILAGCPVGGTVLDPFFGSGTTGQVALELGRNCIGIELNPKYVELAKQRCSVTPGLQLA